MDFIRLFISDQLGQSEHLTVKKKVLRFCRKHVAFLMVNSWILKNIIKKRVVKYWAINPELLSLYESIYQNTDGIENYLDSLPLKELLDRGLAFFRLLEIQLSRLYIRLVSFNKFSILLISLKYIALSERIYLLNLLS